MLAAGTQPGTQLCIAQAGVAKSSHDGVTYGNHYFIIKVDIPTLDLVDPDEHMQLAGSQEPPAQQQQLALLLQLRQLQPLNGNSELDVHDAISTTSVNDDSTISSGITEGNFDADQDAAEHVDGANISELDSDNVIDVDPDVSSSAGDVSSNSSSSSSHDRSDATTSGSCYNSSAASQQQEPGEDDLHGSSHDPLEQQQAHTFRPSYAEVFGLHKQ